MEALDPESDPEEERSFVSTDSSTSPPLSPLLVWWAFTQKGRRYERSENELEAAKPLPL
jgi:hypothetical protein